MLLQHSAFLRHAFGCSVAPRTLGKVSELMLAHVLAYAPTRSALCCMLLEHSAFLRHAFGCSFRGTRRIQCALSPRSVRAQSAHSARSFRARKTWGIWIYVKIRRPLGHWRVEILGLMLDIPSPYIPSPGGPQAPNDPQKWGHPLPKPLKTTSR